MILQMDAWNIRKRDDWGKSAALRRGGKEPERWHWIYTGTCFRLDHRAQTAGGRPVIVERGFVATRTGIDGLRQQLHAEAMRRGLGQAAGARHCRRSGVDMAPGRRSFSAGAPAAGLLSRGATSGGGGPGGFWQGQSLVDSLAQTAGAAIEEPIGPQSHPATGRGAGRIARGRGRGGGAQRSQLFLRASGEDGLPGGPPARRTHRQRPGGSHLSSGPMSIQETGAILEVNKETKHCSVWKPSGATAAALPLSPRLPSLPCKKLRCALLSPRRAEWLAKRIAVC
jgi:hypothetical protein